MNEHAELDLYSASSTFVTSLHGQSVLFLGINTVCLPDKQQYINVSSNKRIPLKR